jgi:transcription elongation GreA/GreB family factor
MRTRPPPQCGKFATGGRGARARKSSGRRWKRIRRPFGTTVTLRRDDGREQTFRIVGEDEADPSRGSPVARVVMTCRPGDTVEIAGGEAEILDVR